ncbi:MAG: glucose 1-dehydrogenase [Spirochaetes bacterium]|jgi:NAD(P)-dependent dehydrogenase (short-subunit alcohol dehydrogenase family)|nr:glucose 1-dehydrogenase [Spirochaetota bacterium]
MSHEHVQPRRDPADQGAPGSLAGRVAIVTGAARGIGAATAALLAGAGAQVAVSDIDLEPAEEVAAGVNAGGAGASDAAGTGGGAAAFQADVSKLAEIEALVNAVTERFGRIDILVNNAGVCPRIPIEEMTEEWFDRMVDINMKSVFFLTRAAARIMREHGFGRVVNVSSTGGRIGGVVNATVYSATKGGILAMTKSLAREYAAAGILVNAVAPGAVDTRMFTNIGQEKVAAYVDGVPLKRLADPREIADGIVYLCLPSTTWVTGATLDINGGVVMV